MGKSTLEKDQLHNVTFGKLKGNCHHADQEIILDNNFAAKLPKQFRRIFNNADSWFDKCQRHSHQLKQINAMTKLPVNERSVTTKPLCKNSCARTNNNSSPCVSAFLSGPTIALGLTLLASPRIWEETQSLPAVNKLSSFAGNRHFKSNTATCSSQHVTSHQTHCCSFLMGIDVDHINQR